ncbi:MAG: hypothetical protein NUW01_05915 [Gemmatimonadaceae bacterium]|nr:hypothetical protein [Gemmatimonadaceae bacterium]
MTKPGTSASSGASRLPGSRAVWWGLAAAAILLGFADLWRGGETIAPILLVVGYLVLVPIAILK